MVWRRAVVAIAVVGCGRVGFDATGAHLGDDSGGALVDAVEPAACVPSGSEVCNGLDDDCNGAVDETCSCASFNTMYSITGVSAPPIAWSGSGYYVLEQVGNALDVRRIAADGSTVSDPISIGSSTAITIASGHDAFAWSGTHLAIVWNDTTNTAHIALLDAGTGMLGAPVTFAATGGGSDVRVAWAGDRFVAAWLDAAGHPTFVELAAATGAVLGQPHSDTQATFALLDSLDVSASHVALAGRVSISGQGDVSIVERTTFAAVTTPLAFGSYPTQLTIVRGPGGFAVVSGAASGNANFQAFGPSGTATTGAIMVPFQISGSDFISNVTVAPTLTQYALAAYTVPISTGSTHTVHLVMVDSSGTAAGPSKMLSSYSASMVGYPSMVSAGPRVGVIHPYTPGAAPVQGIQICN